MFVFFPIVSNTGNTSMLIISDLSPFSKWESLQNHMGGNTCAYHCMYFFFLSCLDGLKHERFYTFKSVVISMNV